VLPNHRFFGWVNRVLPVAAAFVVAACDQGPGTQRKETGPLAPSAFAKDSHLEIDAEIPRDREQRNATALVETPAGKPDFLAPDQTIADAYPPHGSPLGTEEAHRLLSGKVIFNPGSIASSNVPADPDLPLKIGEDVQVKYGNSWWAGTIVGPEPDGRVRIHYFGWADSWDEAKTRAELQVDRNARVRALDSTYMRKGW
jgi:hypothetical protein